MREKRNLKTAIRTGIMLFSVLLFSQCKKEDLNAPQGELPKLGAMPNGVKLAASGITSSSYYLVNSLPSGYVKDGSRDYTSYVQAAVSKYSNVVFPGFPILVNDQGIVIGSNKTITFEEGSELRLKGSSKGAYNILKIAGASNVTLYNPVIVGDRYTHIGTGGEWGMGIGILGSSNITIYSPKVTNCWGDGIYIAQLNARTNCKNIVIKDAYLSKNRRDGISIISVDGLLLDNIYAGYTSGTAPSCGINFEANNELCEFKNIRINNPRTEFNASRGIQIGTQHLVGDVNKTMDITIVNHVDIGSTANAIRLSARNMDGNTGKMTGVLNIINPSWRKTANDVPLNLNSKHPGYVTTISSPEVINTSGRTLSYTEIYNQFITQTSRASLNVTNVLNSVIEPTPAPETALSQVVFAVNAGGSSFKASNGITYASDRNYNGGQVFSATGSITNTSDDILYQSERFGNFGYDIPLSDGTYEITFRLAEIYHSDGGGRRFDILVENSAVVENLDMFALWGARSARDLVKSVTVTDGTLNLDFRTDIDNAKVSAFHIIKK